MRRSTTAIVLTALAAVALAQGDRPVVLPPNPQQLGDPDAGRDYLFHGGYVGAGVPIELWKTIQAGREPDTPIEREGVDPSVPHTFNQFVTPDGAEVVGGLNCLGCHASPFRGEYIVGLGNTFADFTDAGADPAPLGVMATLAYPPDSPEIASMKRFLRGAAALRGKAIAPYRGLNPAFRIEEVAAAQRNPEDLAWTEEPGFEVSDRVIASDVPPWWNIKKKHALYYNGMGRGDYSKLLQQIGVVMIEDADHAATITPHMRDLLAYLHTLEPPAYPNPIDAELAAIGEQVFVENCASCHGTYGSNPTYPNKLVPTSKVGTDPLYARALMESGLHDWYTASWFATGDNAADKTSYAEPTLAYIAPPLDGVWCTAPYFHNGSVPTLDGVIDSSIRPERWVRSFRDDDYDLERMGWNHTEPASTEVTTPWSFYDTTQPGYGNEGHTFGDDLSDDERRALLEYLKTL